MDGSVIIRNGTMIKDTTFGGIEDISKLDYTLDWFESKKVNNLIKKFI